MMSLPASIQALLVLWPDLPRITGVDWPRLFWRLLDLLRVFEQADDEEARAAVSLDLIDILKNLPGGREALRRVYRAELRIRGSELVFPAEGERAPTDGPDEATLNAHLQAILHPPTVTRYTDISAPSQVLVGERFPIVVGLTRDPVEGQQATAIQTQLNDVIQVVLTPCGPELLSEPVKMLQVTEGDSEPVVFYLRAVTGGMQSVLIDFYVQNHLLVSITHSLIATADKVTTPLVNLARQQVALRGFTPPYPDLVLRVSTRENRLTYTLNYADTTLRIIQGETLRTDPERYRYQLLREIENLAKGLDADGNPLNAGQPISSQDMLRHLERIGHRLYEELFSADLRREYCERIRGRVVTYRGHLRRAVASLGAGQALRYRLGGRLPVPAIRLQPLAGQRSGADG
jgi:hypothetical protein